VIFDFFKIAGPLGRALTLDIRLALTITIPFALPRRFAAFIASAAVAVVVPTTSRTRTAAALSALAALLAIATLAVFPATSPPAFAATSFAIPSFAATAFTIPAFAAAACFTATSVVALAVLSARSLAVAFAISSPAVTPAASVAAVVAPLFGAALAIFVALTSRRTLATFRLTDFFGLLSFFARWHARSRHPLDDFGRRRSHQRCFRFNRRRSGQAQFGIQLSPISGRALGRRDTRFDGFRRRRQFCRGRRAGAFNLRRRGRA
jgi:hypothetical protein